uniref:Reverse transcriptase domain-containing protein n=1 Tax=Tanacetum cinerariifolium TaxID=118510 RepID=A0A6L2JG18_TANCI|nr:reverse transcriptase domain-containing protein [Tanacetum cinerariifolium]
MLKIIESKSRVRQTRAKAVVAKVSTSSSTPVVSSEVAKLKYMVRALLLDKKNQSSAPASYSTPAPVKAIKPNCVTCGGTQSYQNCLATSGNVYQENIQDFEEYSKPGSKYAKLVSKCAKPVGQFDGYGVQTLEFQYRFIFRVRDTPCTPMPNLKPSIPYPSRCDNERRRDQDNKQIEKFYKIFKDMSFEISFTDALILMPNFASTQKALIGNKEKLSETARTPMNEHCSTVILNKLPRKLEHPEKFRIPCEFPGMDECLALADLGASINLMPLSVWEGLSLSKLTPTCMTLELADRSVSKLIGIAKDVLVKVGEFHFPADLVVVDFEPDPRVPLILGRCFLKTGRALIDVHKVELTLRIGNKAITYNLDQTLRYSANYNQMTANKIDVICEMYSQEVLGFSDVTASGNPTPFDDLIVSTTSPTLTPFKDSDFLLFEEADAFLGLEDDLNSPKFDPSYYDPEGDLLLLEAILNSEPFPPLPNHDQYLPSFKKELKVCEDKTVKSSVDEPPKVELKDLPPHLEYAFLEGDNKLPDVIAKELGDEEKSALIKVLKSHKRAITWKLSDIQGGFIVVENEENELIPTRLVTEWRMLERLAGKEYYCFLNGFSGYFQIPIDPRDQEKTTFTCPYGTFAYRCTPFGLYNAPGTFRRCMLAIFHDMFEKTMKAFMDDFSVFGNSFENCLSRLDKMLQTCEDTNLSLNWEKSHFMIKEGIVLGHKISKNKIEVDKAKVDVIAKLPHPMTVKGIRSFLGHAGFYRRFIKDFSKISLPMTHLLEKNNPFVFSVDCIKAFQTLKKKIKEAPILIAPNWDLPFELMCDASDFAIGAVLGQRHEKHFKPIHYASKTMNDSESNYTTTEKEMLAVVYKGKEIAKPITPQYETASEEDNDPEQAQRDKDMQKNLALIAKTVNVAGARENVGSLVVQQSGIQCFNCKEFRHFAKECRKPKRVKDSAYHKEKILLCKQAEQGVPLQGEQYDWLADTDEEIDEQELEAHYSYMTKIQEVPTADSGTDFKPLEQVQNDVGYNVFANELQHSKQSESISNTCLMETNDSNVIPDSPDMCDDDIQNDQNDVESDDERVVLANLKLDVDENKKIQKQLKKANTTPAQELKECKTILAETSNTLGESISVRDSYLVALQNKQTEFEKYKAFNDRTVDYDKLKHKLNETLGQLAQKDIKIKEGLVKQKTKVITDLKLREEHDIDKMMSMEKQLKFLNEIVYKRSQSIQTIHMMASKVSTYNGRPTFANPRYLKQAQSEIPCLYTFPYDQSTHANRLIPDGEEILALERESRSKLNKDLVHPYDYTTLNSLYEIFKPPTQEYVIQLAHANEIRKKMWQKSFVKYKRNIYKNVRFLPVSKSINKTRQTYNVMINHINQFKEIVDNAWIKHSKDQFCAPTAQDMEILIQTCLMPLAIKTQNDSFIFVHELKQEMYADLKYVESLEKEIDELEFDKVEFSNMYDMILQESVSNDVMCSYLLSLSDLDALAELQCLYLYKVKEMDIQKKDRYEAKTNKNEHGI